MKFVPITRARRMADAVTAMAGRWQLGVAAAVFGVLAAGSAGASPILTGNATADNYFFAFLSTDAATLGTLIGSGNNWGSTYALTATSLTPGTTYYLNIEAINGDSGSYSAGGFIGDFKLSGAAKFANGSQEILTGASNWLASYNDSNNADTPQAWRAPTGGVVIEGANGVGPWGGKSGISASADWIWPSDARSSNTGNPAPGNQCAACTVDFQTTIQPLVVPEPATWALMLAGAAGLGGALRARRRTARTAA